MRYLKCILTQVVLAVVVIGYSVYGGFLFLYLESDASAGSRTRVKDLRTNFKNAMWERSRMIRTEKDKKDWSRDADKIIREFQQNVFLAVAEKGWDGEEVGDVRSEWTTASSILYCITLITTIGYGNITPRTTGGKLFTMFYSALGIPIFLVFLANVGSVLATGIRALYTKITKTRKYKEGTRTPKRARVPFWLSLQIITAWILLGAMAFSQIEESWDFLTAAYFSFVTLSTIGLGDYVPGTEYGKENNVTLIFTSLYVVIGMALLVTSFELIQEEVISKVKKLAKKMKCSSRPDKSTRFRELRKISLEPNEKGAPDKPPTGAEEDGGEAVSLTPGHIGEGNPDNTAQVTSREGTPTIVRRLLGVLSYSETP